MPYQREMLDAVCDPDVQGVVLMTSSQVGKTTVLDLVESYFITQDPAPMLVVFPTLQLAEAYSRDRLAQFIAATPALSSRIDLKSRDSGNTLLHKAFPGGHLTLAGANSAASLASRPVRIVICDEVDSYPADADGQGDPVDLAKQRATRFFNRVVILAGTPTRKGLSRLERAFKDSDQRHRWVPCPACDAFQVLHWEQVRWDRGPKGEHYPDTARYVCEHCGHGIRDAERLAMDARGEWRPTRRDEQGQWHPVPFNGIAGFHMWEGYVAPQLSALAREWLEKYRSPQQRQTFINLKLGELYEADGTDVDFMGLRNRAEDYPTLEADGFLLPEPVLLVTAGVDVQDNRLACVLRGWGRGEESWLLCWGELWGDPAEQDVWDQLDAILTRPLPHPWGTDLVVQSAGVDSGGHRTQAVYAYAMRRAPRVFAAKGVNQPGRPVIAGRPTPQEVTWEGERIEGGVQLWHIGADTAKEEIYSRFAIAKPGPKFYHFPESAPEDYFKQITSERVTTRYRAGVPVLTWVLPSGRRNEALDAEVLAYAAALRVGMARMNWDQLAGMIRAAGDRARELPPPAPDQGNAAPPRPRRRPLPTSTWMKRGRR